MLRSQPTILFCLPVLAILLGLLGPVTQADARQKLDPKEMTKAVLAANDRFAMALYHRLAAESKNDNLFFSPYSISSALTMTYEGARGKTATQMGKVLFIQNGSDLYALKVLDQFQANAPNPHRHIRSEIHKVFGSINTRLNTKTDNYRLSVANALWAEQSFALLPQFTNALKQPYGAAVTPMNFKGAPEPSRKGINLWVEDHTNKKIKNLLPQGSVTSDSRLVLTNAIHFKGNWLVQFKKKLTRQASFNANGKIKRVQMMNRKGDYPYAAIADAKCSLLELPYKGKELSMVIVLPDKGGGLGDVERKLSAVTLSKWVKQLRKQEVTVQIPKFTMTRTVNLNKSLKAMGMTDAFAPGTADFSGIDGSKQLFISGVFHKAFVDVNEEGTEAAAATAVVIGITSVRRITRFRADHPFIFVIRDKKSGSILFMGRVMNPGK